MKLVTSAVLTALIAVTATVNLFAQTWETVGKGMGAEAVFLAVNNQDVPYLAYQDLQYSFYLTKLNNGIWEPLAHQAYSGGGESHMRGLAIGKSGTPYILNMSGNEALNVVTYSSGAFHNVGPALPKKLNDNWPIPCFLAVYGDDVPYVAFLGFGANNDAKNGSIMVMKYVHNAWQMVGDPISSHDPALMGMSLDKNGNPYIMYEDRQGLKPYVVTYKKSAWTNVGSFPSINTSTPPDFGQRIAYYGDDFYVIGPVNASGKNPLQVCSGLSLSPNGVEGFLTPSSTQALGTSIAIDNNGVPYAAYVDATGKPEVWKLEGGLANGHWVHWGEIPAAAGLNPNFLSISIYNGKPIIVYLNSNTNAHSTFTVLKCSN